MSMAGVDPSTSTGAVVKPTCRFRAAVLRSLNAPLTLETIETYGLRRGEVLVRVHFSGVCHSQLMEKDGARGPDRYLPHLLGHEGTGVVVDIGEGVTKVRRDQKVVLGWVKGSGLEASGIRYKGETTDVNAGGVTTFNEYAVVSENRLVALPESIPMDLGVLLGCALPTGAGIVINNIQPQKGKTIAVFGLGGIGLSALLACSLYEPTQLIAVDVSDQKLQLAKELGATHLIQAKATDPLAAIREITKGEGVDYAVEAAGLAATIESAFQSVKRFGGLCVFASHPPSEARIKLDPYDLICGKQIRGSWGGGTRPDEDIPLYGRLYSEGRLPLEKMISKRYRLQEINEALEDLRHQRALRPLIELI